MPLLRNITRFWTANDGHLVFEIVFDRAWRTGDLDPPAVAIVRCACSLDERHEVAIYEDRPSWFAIDFSSGYHVHGTLRQQGDVQIGGTACLTIFADIYYRQFGREQLFHFDGGMVACPSVSHVGGHPGRGRHGGGKTPALADARYATRRNAAVGKAVPSQSV
ncbi:MAG: hypothetical protein WCS75_07305 [Sphingomonas sp.]